MSFLTITTYITTNNTTLKEAFELFSTNTCKQSWRYKSEQIIQFIENENARANMSKRKDIISFLKNLYAIHWKKKTPSESKMRTYMYLI